MGQNIGEIVVIDFETTGLSPKTARVIEVAAAVIKDGTVISTYSQLMNAGELIPPFIQSLTGITNAMVAHSPSPKEIMPILLEYIGDRPLLAHNAPFDRNFLKAEIQRIGLSLSNPFFCSLVLSRRFIPEAPSHRLQALAKHLNISQNQAHRALSDVMVTAELWAHLQSRICQELSPQTLDLPWLERASTHSRKKLKELIEREISLP